MKFLNHDLSSQISDNDIIDPESPGIIYIRENNFRIINRELSLAQIISQSINKGEALQAFKAGTDHKNSRYIIHMKRNQGN